MVQFIYRPVTPDTLSDLTTFSSVMGSLDTVPACVADAERRVSACDETGACCTPAEDGGGRQAGGCSRYDGHEPVGWCSIAPRETCEALERYKALPRIDAAPVWSVVCFFVVRRYRGQHLMVGLLKAGLDYARSMGARSVEGYPVDPGRLYTYMGSPATFRSAGFRDVAPSGQGRRIVRCDLA